MTTDILLVFQSQALMVGGLRNTAFSTTPTQVTEANASEVFCYDHTTILFRDGRCLGANFEYATAIPFDIDNSHSDNPEDWVTTKNIARRLKEFGINYYMVASRNHMLSKEKKWRGAGSTPKVPRLPATIRTSVRQRQICQILRMVHQDICRRPEGKEQGAKDVWLRRQS